MNERENQVKGKRKKGKERQTKNKEHHKKRKGGKGELFLQ